MGIMGIITFAACFYGIAQYENLTAWKWAAASVAISIGVRLFLPYSFVWILPGQFALFVALWMANQKAKKEREIENAAAKAEDLRKRRERVSKAREQAAADPEREKRQAAAEAAEEAERKERLERVRLAREERERQEREQAQGRGPSTQ